MKKSSFERWLGKGMKKAWHHGVKAVKSGYKETMKDYDKPVKFEFPKKGE